MTRYPIITWYAKNYDLGLDNGVSVSHQRRELYDRIRTTVSVMLTAWLKSGSGLLSLKKCYCGSVVML